MGATFSVEHPEPAPLHPASDHPRVFAAVLSEVPPTAVTYRELAGYDGPVKPLSPVDAVTAMPGWL